MKASVASVIRRAIIRAAHAQTLRLWPGNTYPDATEMTAAMLGADADEVRRVVYGEASEGGYD